MSNHPKLFGTDGARGEFTRHKGPGLINLETFEGLTAAAVDVLEPHCVVVGTDTRASSPELAQAAIRGAVMAGTHTIDIGISPTPVTGWTLSQLESPRSIAISVTASHNQHGDNGLKVLLPGGEKLSKAQTDAIENLYWGFYAKDLHTIKPNGSFYEDAELASRYTGHIIEAMQEMFGERPLQAKIFVLDTAYGAAREFTPSIFEALGATVYQYDRNRYGRINDGCGANNLSGLTKYLTDNIDITKHPKFMGALANDGDGDRVMGVGIVDGQPVKIDGNHFMRYLAADQPGVVGTEYTNSALVGWLKQHKIGFEYCPNGDSFVTEALKKKQNVGLAWKRGGEFTGHLIDTDHLLSGDGIYMAAWLACTLALKGKTFGDAYEDLPLWQESMQGVPYVPRPGLDVINDPQLIKLIEQSKQDLGDEGRLIVRASGTEPVLRVWGEALDPHQLNRVTFAIAKLVNQLAA